MVCVLWLRLEVGDCFTARSLARFACCSLGALAVLIIIYVVMFHFWCAYWCDLFMILCSLFAFRRVSLFLDTWGYISNSTPEFYCFLDYAIMSCGLYQVLKPLCHAGHQHINQRQPNG